jgi:hypothetical protein
MLLLYVAGLMPDTRRHRGPHPQDADLFAQAVHPTLRQAAAHLSWLLSRGYAQRSSLKLVGDRFGLVERQRRAVLRSACSDAARADRVARRVEIAQLCGRTVAIDGFNLLTTIEAALAGGVLLLGSEGALRDMASMHGSYRKVHETRPALELIGGFCERAGVGRCHWWLDQPVSNSARLRTIMLELAEEHGWTWQVTLHPNPDMPLCQTDQIVVSADAAILDACRHWHNLAAELVAAHVPDAWMVDFRQA